MISRLNTFILQPNAVHAALSAACLFALGACSSATEPLPTDVGLQERALRSLTNAEALTDFDEMVASMRGLYGAMQRKQTRYDFSFDDLAADYRDQIQQATTEPEYMALFRQFGARFHDAHIYFSQPVTNDVDTAHAYALPVYVMPVEDTFVVYHVDPSLDPSAGIARGDELVSFDGVPTADAVAKFSGYQGVPNPSSALQFAANYLTRRPSFAAAGIEPGSHATLHVRSENGDEHDVEVPWAETQTHPLANEPQPPSAASAEASTLAYSAPLAELLDAQFAQRDARVPFYMTQPVHDAFEVGDPITPSPSALARVGLETAVAALLNYYAVHYRFQGKTFLLLRIHSFNLPDGITIADAINYLRALLSEQAQYVDGLVLDETHNSGGRIELAERVAQLLATGPIRNLVQAMHADRDWIENYLKTAKSIRSGSGADAETLAAAGDVLDGYAKQIDAAYSANQLLSEPIPFPWLPVTTIPADPLHWSKPFVLLADELSMSSADMLPLLVEANQLGPVFGQRTAGAGADVEQVISLTNSQLGFNISRGLTTIYDPSGAYPDSNFIEDHGVTPNISYSHTLADFRAGYLGYVTEFSKALLAASAPITP